ncbi:MAG: YraN family protein [Deltaproteobacteria bacterium]
MDKRSVGKAGEDAAADFLRKKGYRILGRNVRCRRGELDIVARHGRTVCFIEVRSRRNTEGHAAQLESVDARKRLRLARLALAYLKDRGWLERRARFDVVSVLLRAGDADVALLQDAFSLDDIPVLS